MNSNNWLSLHNNWVKHYRELRNWMWLGENQENWLLIFFPENGEVRNKLLLVEWSFSLFH